MNLRNLFERLPVPPIPFYVSDGLIDTSQFGHSTYWSGGRSYPFEASRAVQEKVTAEIGGALDLGFETLRELNSRPGTLPSYRILQSPMAINPPHVNGWVGRPRKRNSLIRVSMTFCKSSG